MMSTCYCTKNNVCVSKHHRVRESMCVCVGVCVCVRGCVCVCVCVCRAKEKDSERGRERKREVKRAERKIRQNRKGDLAQRAEGKVSAPAEENVL